MIKLGIQWNKTNVPNREINLRRDSIREKMKCCAWEIWFIYGTKRKLSRQLKRWTNRIKRKNKSRILNLLKEGVNKIYKSNNKKGSKKKINTKKPRFIWLLSAQNNAIHNNKMASSFEQMLSKPSTQPHWLLYTKYKHIIMIINSTYLSSNGYLA